MKTLTIKLGDMVQVGLHRVACGDSCDADLVSKIFAKNKANLIVTDVPYGVAYVENKANTKQTQSVKSSINPRPAHGGGGRSPINLIMETTRQDGKTDKRADRQTYMYAQGHIASVYFSPEKVSVN